MNQYCDLHYMSRAVYSLDNIPFHFHDGETLPVGSLNLCYHCARNPNLTPVYSEKGYTLNVIDEEFLTYLENQNRLIGSSS